MEMHNPPHPGEFIHSVYMEPFGLSADFWRQNLTWLHPHSIEY